MAIRQLIHQKPIQFKASWRKKGIYYKRLGTDATQRELPNAVETQEVAKSRDRRGRIQMSV